MSCLTSRSHTAARVSERKRAGTPHPSGGEALRPLHPQNLRLRRAGAVVRQMRLAPARRVPGRLPRPGSSAGASGARAARHALQAPRCRAELWNVGARLLVVAVGGREAHTDIRTVRF